MKEFKRVNFNITAQGAPKVNEGCIYREGEEIVAITIDLESKYCYVSAHGARQDEERNFIPFIHIDADEKSLYLDETKGRESFTELEFPDFKGWRVWSSGIGRYTLSVCLVKDEE